jgi:hypothetical protein
MTSTSNKYLENYNTSELIVENISKISDNDLGLYFNSFKSIRDKAIKDKDLEKARIEQAKIFALFSDGRLEEIFIQNEIGFSRICDVEQFQKDRQMICPDILRQFF